jgi:hypothetical protein
MTMRRFIAFLTLIPLLLVLVRATAPAHSTALAQARAPALRLVIFETFNLAG